MRSIREIFRSHAQFDAEGRHVNGTDKQSNHNYGDAYEEIFTYCATERRPAISGRKDVSLFMEVGVADGACLQAWKEVFPNAQIVGMDIHPSAQAVGDRIEFHLGDQRSKEDCERAAQGRKFDVIIEDAVHSLDNSLLTLFYLWPFVKRGGLYIIEEFDNVHGSLKNIRQLFPMADVIDTKGPFGGNEPLVVFRK